MADAYTAARAQLGVDLTIHRTENSFFNHVDGLLGTVEKAGPAADAYAGIDVGFKLLFPAFYGGPSSLWILNRSLTAGLKADAAFLTYIGVDFEADFDFTENGVLGALFGASSAPDTVIANIIRH